MKSNLYSVYDSKTEDFSPPFLAPTDGAAIRMFSDTVNKPGSQLYEHPEDFCLFFVGEWDSSNGMLNNKERPVCSVIMALNCKTKQEVKVDG